MQCIMNFHNEVRPSQVLCMQVHHFGASSASNLWVQTMQNICGAPTQARYSGLAYYSWQDAAVQDLATNEQSDALSAVRTALGCPDAPAWVNTVFKQPLAAYSAARQREFLHCAVPLTTAVMKALHPPDPAGMAPYNIDAAI